MPFSGQEKVSLIRALLPFKVLLAQFYTQLLLLLCAALIFLSQVNYPPIIKAKTLIMDGLTPIISVMHAPVETVNRAVMSVTNAVVIYDENKALKEQLKQYTRLKEVVLALHVENKQLRKMVGMTSNSNAAYASGRIVGFNNSMLGNVANLNIGLQHGVTENNLVINSAGVIGKTINVGNRSSSVMLITDMRSKIPVILERSRVKAMASGDNKGGMILHHILGQGVVKPGEKVITSGDGKMFPTGLSVGVVSSVGRSGVQVKPVADIYKLEYVTVIQK